ncbi:MAG: biotin/lipoyl-binding protein [Candidatus Paceibacteria bacterium]
MHTRLHKTLHIVSHPVIALGGALLISLAGVAIALHMTSVAPSGEYTAAILAPIEAAGGANSDLSFQMSGQVASVPVAIGQQVSAGSALVVLDRSALEAQRAGAVANLEAAQARLATLKAGTRPEQVSVDQTAVTQSREALLDVVRSSYINADDAIHNKVDQFFTNPRLPLADLTFTVSDSALRNTVLTERIALETVLSTWGTTVNTPTFAASDPLADGSRAQTDLSQVSAFLDTIATLLAETSPSANLPLATLQGYQASINAARLNVSGSVSAITNATTALQAAQGALTLAQAGATKNDIDAAQASVDGAQAALGGIDVSLRQAMITAPITGTITALNARVGQTVSPGQVLVSIESTGGSKKDALVIPKSGIIEDTGQTLVYVKDASGTPVKTVVTVGLVSANGMAEITSGLSVGQEVLTFGTSIK